MNIKQGDIVAKGLRGRRFVVWLAPSMRDDGVMRVGVSSIFEPGRKPVTDHVPIEGLRVVACSIPRDYWDKQ